MKIRKVANVTELSNMCDYEDDWSGESFEISNDQLNPDVIITCGEPVFVETNNLLLIEGTYMVPDEDNPDLLVPDWSLTLIYKWSADKEEFNESDAADYAYFEQDPMPTALHNYLEQLKSLSSV